MTALIAAMTEERVIGKDGVIPWHLPEDLALFKRLTTGHTVIMGRRTFESLGKPLPHRRNIVVSRTLTPVPGIEIFGTPDKALDAAGNGGGDIFFIGGASIYREGLRFADTMYLSIVKGSYEGDTYFPGFDEDSWHCVERTEYPGFSLTLWKRTRLPGS